MATTTILGEKIQYGLHRLARSSGLVLPFNHMPYTSYPHHLKEVTQEMWEALEWNPPNHPAFEGMTPDPEASPKPPWNSLYEACKKEEKVILTNNTVLNLHLECRKRITAGYQASDWRDEIQKRLRGVESKYDIERDRLRDRYKALKVWVNDEDRTFEELKQFNVYKDINWID